MKASTIAAILSFSVAALAAPITYTVPKHSSPFGKRDLQTAVNDCSNTANPSLCEQVVTTINSWDVSVNGVNDFLNTAEGLTNPDLTNAENTALGLANLEPGFLSVLQGTPGLSAAGQQAATTLGQVFGAVPQNLQDLLDASESVQTAVDNINSVRCAQILGNIGQLWVESAAAVGADTPGFPLGPLVCVKTGGNVGDAFN
ncbi:hypothetical protein BDZ45DRAFT_164092 [Acephala macrosclerotiorum]|nr:hypothetical protein BDZ45DRAFT_164092 [Acephala macrosclerotiorum]